MIIILLFFVCCATQQVMIPEKCYNTLEMIDSLSTSCINDGVTLIITKEIYQNPFSIEARYEIEVCEDGEYSIGFYDIRDSLVVSILTGNLDQGQYKFLPNLSNQSSGIYFLNCYQEDALITSSKFIFLK